MDTTAFADMADDLDFGSSAPVRPMSEIAQPRYVTVPAAVTYTQACPKCGGTGIFRSYTGRSLGNCFSCKGAGKFEFKTSPEQRARATQQRHDRQERARQENLDAFAAERPAAYAWMVAQAPRFEFAASMLEALKKWGTLTEGQLAAVERCIQRDAERAAERAATRAAAPKAAAITMPALYAVMQNHSKFYAGAITLSRGREHQTVWIKHESAEKAVGKIENGLLTMWNRPGVDMDAVRETLNEFEGAPLQSAMKYGKLTGRCCSCGRELTDPDSIEAGIGPICAGKF